MSDTKELRKPVSLQNLNSPSRSAGTRIGPYLVGKTLGVGSTGKIIKKKKKKKKKKHIFFNAIIIV